MSEKKFFKNRKLKINAVPKFAKIGIIFSFFLLFFQFPDIIFSFLNDPGKGGPEDIMQYFTSKMTNFLYVVQCTIQFKISIFKDAELIQQQTVASI